MTPPHQPRFLYTAEQSRAVDRCAIEEHGLPGALLMARAARAAFERLLERVPQPERLQVLCGPGNNGGDGLLLAMLAQGRGIPVRVYLVDGPPRTDDAQRAAARARRAGIAPRRFAAAALETALLRSSSSERESAGDGTRHRGRCLCLFREGFSGAVA